MPSRPKPSHHAARPLLHILLGLTLAGCEVGPDFHRPTVPADAGYTTQLPPRLAGPAMSGAGVQSLAVGGDVAGRWWQGFGSAELDRLEDQALRNNPTLAAAQATLLQARETVRADQGTFFPTVSGTFGAMRQKISPSSGGTFGGAPVTPTTGSTTTGNPGTTSFAPFDLYNATVNVSYGLDVFGGLRRGLEQAQALAENQRFVLEATYLTLTSNIVAAAIVEASLTAQIAATEQVIDAERHGLALVRAQLEAGATTRADVLQQQAQLETSLATLPPLQSQLAQEHNLLATYVGVFPPGFQAPSFDLAKLRLPAELPVSLPSSLVEQRPDIRQSEATLHAQTAAVGVATANLLPKLTLTGSVGTDAARLGQLFTPGTLVYTLAGELTQQIFQGGALVHQRRAAIAAMQAAAATYRNTVITAFADVSNALLALQYDATGLQVALDAAQAAHDSLALLQVQYTAGAINYLSVLTAQQTEQNALVTLARAQAARYTDTVALFQALGGGWWHRDDIAASVAHCCAMLPRLRREPAEAPAPSDPPRTPA